MVIFRQLTCISWNLKCYIAWQHLLNVSECLLGMFFSQLFITCISFSAKQSGCSFLFNFCLLYLPDDGPSDSSKMFNCLKQIDSMLSSCVCSVNRSQMMSKYAKNISDIWFMMRYHFQLLSLLYSFPIYHPIGRWYAIIFRNKRMQWKLQILFAVQWLITSDCLI